MKNIYLFSGLGVDHRMFQYLNFDGYSITHVEWITPLKNESMSNYALRLSNQIKDTNAIFIGLSFGGVMAIEVSKHIPAQKIILLASIKTHHEIPFYFRWMGKTKIHKLLPVSLVKTPNLLSEWMFDVRTKRDKKLFKEILTDMSPEFVRWAVDRLLSWNNLQIPSNLLHIHAKTDKVLPHAFVKSDISLDNGGHFMTINKAQELSSILKTYLNTEISPIL